MIRCIRLIGLGLLACAAALAAGCGGHGSVSGTVKHKNGKPVVSGKVTLIASDNMPYEATINPDGTYSFSDVPAGPAKIGVSSPNPAPQPKPAEGGARGGRGRGKDAAVIATKDKGGRTPPVGQAASEEVIKGWFQIKDTYADPQQSGLGVTVQSGPTPYNIEVD